MTLQELKDVCAALHDKTSADLTKNSVDLFLVAVNNALRSAQLRHNFEMARVSATIVIDGANGGSLAAATGVQGGTRIVGVREVVNLRNGRWPVIFNRADVALEQERDGRMLEDIDALRYPSDAALLQRYADTQVTIRGNKLYVYPSNTSEFTLTVEGYGWVQEYTSADYSLDEDDLDFIYVHGRAWLQWAAVVELNHYFKTFVPRTEGNLAPPLQERDTAWLELKNWDAYSVDPHTTFDR